MIRNLRLLAAVPFAAAADVNRFLSRRIAGQHRTSRRLLTGTLPREPCGEPRA